MQLAASLGVTHSSTQTKPNQTMDTTITDIHPAVPYLQKQIIWQKQKQQHKNNYCTESNTAVVRAHGEREKARYKSKTKSKKKKKKKKPAQQ